jgi:addiction module RelE/StbE family toxin
MKKSCDVRWSETSKRDLLAIVYYIADASPKRAYTVFNEIKERALTLRAFPDRRRIVPELLEQGLIQYRELIIAPWRVIYRVLEDKVYVLSVLDSRQNVEDLLLKRLTGLK